MKTVYTCQSGLSLFLQGSAFGAWNDALIEVKEIIIQADDQAIQMEKQEGEYISYLVNPNKGEVKIVGTVSAEYIEKIMVDSKSK